MEKESQKEMDKLLRLRSISLSEPLAEKRGLPTSESWLVRKTDSEPFALLSSDQIPSTLSSTVLRELAKLQQQELFWKKPNTQRHAVFAGCSLC